MLTINMLSDHFGGRLAVPASLNKSTRFSWMVLLSEDLVDEPEFVEPYVRPKTTRRASALRGSVLYCGTPKAVSALLARQPDAFALVVKSSDGEYEQPSTTTSRTLLLMHRGTFASAVETLGRLFAKYGMWVNSMKSALIEGGGYQELLDCSEDVFEDFISVNDSAYRLLGHTSHVPYYDPVACHLVEKGYHSKETVDGFRRNKAIQRWKVQTGIVKVESTLTVKDPTLSYVFRMRGDYFVHVVLQCTTGKMTDGLVDKFQVLIDHIKLYVRQDWNLRHRFNADYSHIFAELLTRRPANSIETQGQLDRLGLKRKSRYMLYVIEMEAGEGDASGILGYGAWRLLEHVPFGKACIYGGKLVLLVDLAEEGVEDAVDPQLLAYIEKFGGQVGSSRVFEDIADMSFAHRQALLSIHYACHASETFERRCRNVEDGRIHRFDFCLGDFLLDAKQHDAALVDFCMKDNPVRRIAALDAERGTDDLRILYCYLRYERKVSAVSELLHLHRSTLLYRIERLQTKFGLDLDDPAVRDELMLGYRVMSSE